jgi:hypothetical protein
VSRIKDVLFTRYCPSKLSVELIDINQLCNITITKEISCKMGKNVQIIASVIFCSILYVMKAFHHLTTDLLPLMFFTDIKCGGTNTAVLHGNTNGATSS